MPSVAEEMLATDHAAQVASAPADTTEGELVSTPAAAALMGFSEATLRNYAWLNSLTAEERASRKLQEPPAGLPVPKRRSGRLLWPLGGVATFVEQKSKHFE